MTESTTCTMAETESERCQIVWPRVRVVPYHMAESRVLSWLPGAWMRVSLSLRKVGVLC